MDGTEKRERESYNGDQNKKENNFFEENFLAYLNYGVSEPLRSLQ
jgi:hypothetical protein